ncbi:MAG: ABC transporter substrate-binding protein [Actinomycetota bacterium]
MADDERTTMRTKLAAMCSLLALASIFPTPSATAQIPPPPVLRVAWDGDVFGFDPVTEYYNAAWELYSSLLLRTLITYRHVAGAEGNELVPDIATEIPEPTNDGLTYTFDLKPGVMFGPPLNRPVTSRDIEFAFERIACRICFATYDFYYVGVIRGLRKMSGPAQPGRISGIETPDDDTIVFHLRKPTGDFLHRLTLPATAPVPREVTRCWPTTQYGKSLVSTGPYMFEGSEDVDLSEGCDSVRKVAGYGPDRFRFVANPAYDPATDDPAIREPVYSKIVLHDMERGEAFRAIAEGMIDVAMMAPTQRQLERFDASQVHSDLEDLVWYMTMNLTQRPFNDVHVRRALNFAIDKPRVLEAWGGETLASPATHILPPTLTGGHPTAEEYDPYGHLDGPDLERARAEMAQSSYDTDGDGLCDAPACSSVVLINRDTEPHPAVEPVIVDGLRSIGIEPEVRRREITTAYTAIGDLGRGIELGMNAGWLKDYADGSTFFNYLFHSRSLTSQCGFTTNYSAVGGTPEIKERCGFRGDFTDLPSVDADIENCIAFVHEQLRDDCWINLDAKLMEEIVPWVPLVWRHAVRVTGPRIGHYEFDQSTSEVSLAHIAPAP